MSRISIDPLFIIEELSPALIQKVPKLKKALELRRQATEIAKYLASCRIAGENIKEEDYKDCIMQVTKALGFQRNLIDCMKISPKTSTNSTNIFDCRIIESLV